MRKLADIIVEINLMEKKIDSQTGNIVNVGTAVNPSINGNVIHVTIQQQAGTPLSLSQTSVSGSYAHGYITDSGNLRMSAEICYRYISGNNDFVEQHTAFADASIEAEILFAILATHKRFTRNCHMGTATRGPRVNIKARTK